MREYYLTMVTNITMNMATSAMSIFVLTYHRDDGVFYEYREFFIRIGACYVYLVTTLYRYKEENVFFRKMSLFAAFLLFLHDLYILLRVLIQESLDNFFEL